ncbi:MAG: aspartic peptidase domain-containing protein [Benjaminiella poitrasii]|nr:MAG: aspartic peptidase domain-containing protein [Benjaminiella poitrasii]
MKLLSSFLTTFLFVLHTCIVSANDKVIKIPIHQRTQTHNNNAINKRASTTGTNGNMTVPLFNAFGKEYLIEIGVGNPPQYFNVTMDTGSADFWIPKSTCPTTACPHSRFDASRSTTYTALSETLSIVYGLGSCSGHYARETITFDNSLALANFTLGLATETKDILRIESSNTSVTSNGIFGLGQPGLSIKTGNKPTHLVQALYNARQIPSPTFSIFLNSQHGLRSELVLGGVDSARVGSEIQYAPIVTYDVSQYYVLPNLGLNATKPVAANNATRLYWAVPGQGVKIAGRSFTNNSTLLQSYIFDSGTTLTYVPDAVAKSIVESFTSDYIWDAINQVYLVDCSQQQQGHVEFLISTSLESSSSAPIVLSVPFSELVVSIDNTCMFGIAPSGGYQLTTGETWILGESTLRSFYTVYDLGRHQMGFAKLAVVSDNITVATDKQQSGNDQKTQVENNAPERISSNTTKSSDASSIIVNIKRNLFLSIFLFCLGKFLL